MRDLSNDGLRQQARERFDALLAAGPGAHAYALDAAEKLVRDEPMPHAGLVARIEASIGADATRDAHRALRWFRGKGQG